MIDATAKSHCVGERQHDRIGSDVSHDNRQLEGSVYGEFVVKACPEGLSVFANPSLLVRPWPFAPPDATGKAFNVVISLGPSHSF